MLFKAFSVIITVVNAIAMCVEADSPPNSAVGAERVNDVCSVLFAIDFFVRVSGSLKDQWYHNGWLVMDGLICFTSAVSYIIAETHFRLVRMTQLLRLMRIFRLSHLFGKWRPLKILLEAISKAWANLIAAGLFIGSWWFILAIVTTSVFRERADASSDTVKQVINTYFDSVPRSFLTAMEATVGGIEWGDAFLHPLFDSGGWFWKIAAVFLLGSTLFSTFCLWNLILGIFVRQVVSIAKDYDKEVDQRDLYEGESSVQQLRGLLDQMDLDGDGYISEEELREGILEDPQALGLIGIGAEEIEVLHQALDTENVGKVGINEFLFGVLKLAGASKTIDMLSIDYRQKVFLRDVVKLERTSKTEHLQLSTALDDVIHSMHDLKGQIDSLKTGIEKSKGDLEVELRREEGRLLQTNRERAEKALLEAARSHEHRLEAKQTIEGYLDSLRAQADELALARTMSELCAGSPKDVAALRSAVRRRLQTQLGPWLEAEIRETGGIAS